MSIKHNRTSSFEKEINDNSIEDDTEQDYISYLKTAPEFVVPDDAAQFFNDILAQFNNKEINEELGLEIFHTLRIFIRSPDFFNEFVDGNFLMQLPFDTNNSNYIRQILNIVYDIIQIDPTKINSPFGDDEHFAKIVKKEPLKSLSLINTFAQKCFNFNYEGIICPWTMIDILYNNIEFFIDYNNTDIFKQYASILLYIFNEYPLYREHRILSYWNLFVNCLSQVSDTAIIVTIYNMLCFLKDYFNKNYDENNIQNKKKRAKRPQKYIAVIKNYDNKDKSRDLQYSPELPIQQILVHIRTNSTVRGAVFKILMSYAMTDPNSFQDAKLIKILIHYATKSLKATLILMTVGENEDVAQLITNNCNLWLDKGLPESVDTLRLFMTVFQHRSLREQLVSHDKFISFLNYVMNDLNNSGTVSIIGSIISHGEISQEVMMKLQKANFITTFLDIASQNDDKSKVSSQTALEFIQIGMSFGIYSDFLPYINWISQLKDVSKLREQVAKVASELSKNEKCAKKMISLHFSDFYEQQLNDPSSSSAMKTEANKLLRRLRKIQKKE